MGLIEETADKIEGAFSRGENRTTPVFGRHLLKKERDGVVLTLTEHIRLSGEYADIHTWPQWVTDQVRKLSPNKVAIDGLSYYPGYSAINPKVDSTFWFSLPGNPFKWRDKEDVFVVLGDVPTFALEEFKHNPGNFYYKHLETNGLKDKDEFTKDFYARQLVVGAAVQIWEDANRSPIDKRETLNFTQEEKEFADEQTREITTSRNVAILGATGAAMLKAAGRPFHRRLMMFGLAMSGAGIANAARVALPLLTDKVPLTPLSHPWRKMGFDASGADGAIKVTDVREVVIDIKLRETKGSKGVAVFGDAHELGKHLWNKPQEQEAFLEEFFVNFLQQVREGAKAYEIDLDEFNTKARVVSELSALFGGTAVLRVKEAPKKLTPKEVSEQIIVDKLYTSPTITKIAQNAGKKAGFIS